MRVLIATNELQGWAPDASSHAVAGELVTALAMQCGRDEECDCNRGFRGLASQFSTTAAVVTDLAHITESDLREAVHDYLDRSGWHDLLREAAGHCDDGADPDAAIADMVEDHVAVISMICRRFPVGTVLERSGSTVTARPVPHAA